MSWTNNRQGLANTMEQLARAMCNAEWKTMFPKATIKVLSRAYSNHSPLVVYTQDRIQNQKMLSQDLPQLTMELNRLENIRSYAGAIEYKLFVGSLNKQATEKEVEEGCDQPLTVRFADPKRPRAGESRGGPAFGGPGFGPRFQPPGLRPTTNLGEPMHGRIPPNAWHPMSPQNMGPSLNAGIQGFGSQLLPRSGDLVMPSTLQTVGRIQRGRATSDVTGSANEAHSQPSEAMRDAAQPNGASGSCQAEVESEAVVLSLQDRIKELEQHVVKKVEEEVVSLQRELSIKDQVDTEGPSKDKPMTMPSSPNSSSKNQPYAVKVKSESKTPGAADPASVRKPSSDISQRAERVAPPINSSHITPALKSDTHKNATPKPTEKPSVQQVPTMSPSNMKSNGPQWMECPPQRDGNRSIHYGSSMHDDIHNCHNLDFYMPVHSRSQDHFSTEFPASISSGRQSQGLFADEFPHLDIINDLLDDEHRMALGARASMNFQSFGNGPHHLNRQLGSHYDPLRDMIPQVNQRPYANGQIDGLIPNQWQMGGSDLSYLSMRNTDGGDGYRYHIPDYSNLACSDNGYTVFRPSNGH
ncbi:Flowering time control protein FCA [Camellia lanceoleosa]|uniref:Flowering time control protein FCA n=1 Tax=Camellia lanceoleosa TaxID=1840588 RepID=A0ACC0HD68_9ERIC|nr:Flowering time control protein FCA [Camellia lanceoleosa]